MQLTRALGLTAIGLLAMLSLCSCAHHGNTAMQTSSTPDMALENAPFTGTLLATVDASGQTRWMLAKSTGQPIAQLDVAGMEDQARSLEGRRVAVSGKWTATSGGQTVLVAEHIAPATN